MAGFRVRGGTCVGVLLGGVVVAVFVLGRGEAVQHVRRIVAGGGWRVAGGGLPGWWGGVGGWPLAGGGVLCGGWLLVCGGWVSGEGMCVLGQRVSFPVGRCRFVFREVP
ncbi:hypothetical protein EOT10_37930 [Streptomyces antnestii]|uniref:Uncharacterized protein n=1 Tax=Streptomyces antnestii TaxID=2494256 RepID=A0A437P0W0_9ACTN|nr:hypothetical protein EOT10_37930 [Streptomyces sp. San01]